MSQTLYITGHTVTIHLDPNAAWVAYKTGDKYTELEQWILKDGCLEHKDRVVDFKDSDRFYRKIVLTEDIANMKAKIEALQKQLAMAEEEANKCLC